MMLKRRPANGGAKITRRLFFLQQGQIALKTAYETIDCTYTSRRFLNAPISLDFQHTLSAGRPSIAENYHVEQYRSGTNKNTTCTITIGMRNRQVFFVLDDAFVRQSRLTTAESAMFMLNKRVADIIKENKVMLYAELMQWANRANFGEVR